jgi:hypothetical protein
MKKLIAILGSLLLIGAAVLTFGAFDNQGKHFQFQFNGRWMPNLPELHVGAENYTVLKNLRPTDTGLETVEGYTKINTTAKEGIINLHHFAKENESHVFAKVLDTGVYYLYENTTAIPAQGDFGGSSLYTVSDGIGSFANGPQGTMFYADDQYNLVTGGNEMRVSAFLVSNSTSCAEAKDFTENISNDVTTMIAEYGGSFVYAFIGSPLKLSGIKLYIADPNVTTSTISVDYANGSSWTGLSITDNTTSGGVSLSQTGTITWTYTDSPTVKYLSGASMYWYRLTLSAGSADIYKATAIAPLQPIRDVWNGVDRTCTAFQAYRTSTYEDYTFQVNEQDSSSGATYAATIGDLTATDFIVVMFDDRVMGFNVSMVAGLTNAASAVISQVQYYNGSSFATVGTLNDGTSDGTSSFNKSGAVTWTPPSNDLEHSYARFGKSGYAYKITLSGTLTGGTNHDGTSIDYIGGITAPLVMGGYNLVGYYNGRVILIDGNRIDYSQTDTPWVFNGIDSSNKKTLSLYFGDEQPIVATQSIFNRYGSNLIEALSVIKKNSTYILTGVQPYSEYSDPFIIKTISDNIGCAAPKTVKSYVMDIGDGLNMRVSSWLDHTGPVAFNGAVIEKIPGIENFFDPTNSDCVNFSYLQYADSYVDTVHNQVNFLFPTGDSTINNKWVVYDYKLKKWFEKSPNILGPVLWDESGDIVLWEEAGDYVIWGDNQYPQVCTSVTDTNGVGYNYGFVSAGHMMRLDNGATWDGSEIAQQITTGEFSPAIVDDKGFWSMGELKKIKLISESTTEDADVSIGVYGDGTALTKSISVALNSGTSLSRNIAGYQGYNDLYYGYKINFQTVTNTDKWRPLAWGYSAIQKRED